jgi:hypothetical protein
MAAREIKRTLCRLKVKKKRIKDKTKANKRLCLTGIPGCKRLKKC